MRTGIKALLLTVAVVFFCTCRKDDPESNDIKIPDNNFLMALTEQGVDRNNNGSIEQKRLTR